MNTRLLFLISSLLCSLWMCAQYGQYVDPRIGSEGVGRTFPGPSMPYGMVKPGPDCGVKPNAGWAPMPEPVTGFSQTHVSGTGGGQKYGNILIQPFLTEPEAQSRESEQVSLGYYATTYVNGIRTEVTTSERCAFYRIHYPHPGRLMIDASHYLGKSDIPAAGRCGAGGDRRHGSLRLLHRARRLEQWRCLYRVFLSAHRPTLPG